MKWQQQRIQILNTIKQKRKQLGVIITKASQENRTPDDNEEAEISEIESDIEKLEKNLRRIDSFIEQEKKAAKTATPTAGTSEAEADASAEGEPEPTKPSQKATVESNLPKGMGFAKAMRAKVQSQLELKKGHYISALDIAKSRNEPEAVIRFLQKDAVIGKTDASEMQALVQPENLSNEFIELLRKRTIFDKLKGFREVPFNTKIVNQLTGGTAQWVGEGAEKPVTNGTFGTVKIEEHKLAAIAVFTDEFLRNSKPKADDVFLEDLLAACAELIDSTFLSDAAGDANKPAGILHNVSAINSTGTDVEHIDADLLTLTSEFLTNNKSLAGVYYIMSEIRANRFARLRDALGNGYYKGMSKPINEKDLDGINVIESETADDKIVLLKPSEILLADDGDVDVSYSDQATIKNGSTTINLWQQNMSAVRVERYISWSKRRATAVSYIKY